MSRTEVDQLADKFAVFNTSIPLACIKLNCCFSSYLFQKKNDVEPPMIKIMIILLALTFADFEVFGKVRETLYPQKKCYFGKFQHVKVILGIFAEFQWRSCENINSQIRLL